MEWTGPAHQRARPVASAAQRRRLQQGPQRVAPHPDFEPLLAENSSTSTAPTPVTYNSLVHPMRTPNVGSPRRSVVQADREDGEAVPLLSTSLLLGESSTDALAERRGDAKIHLPDLRSSSLPHYPARHRSIRRRNVPRDVSRLRIVQNSTPIKTNIFSFVGCCCVQCIRTNEVGVLEAFGQFQEMVPPGLVLLPWPCTRVAGRLSLRVQQLEITCETKTSDNVFVTVGVTVQFRVIKEQAYDAFYRLTNVQTQIRAYVFDVVRSTIPTIELDDLFESKSDIALDVLRGLQGTMRHYGYDIVDTLLTDISPNPLVRAAMNEISAARKLKEAMSHKAEAEKTAKVKAAEALAETLYLNGVGVAKQRKAIANGMKLSVKEFAGEIITPKHVMDLLLVSHYYDILNTIGSEHFFLFHNPDEVSLLQHQISSYFVPEPENRKKSAEEVSDLLW